LNGRVVNAHASCPAAVQKLKFTVSQVWHIVHYCLNFYASSGVVLNQQKLVFYTPYYADAMNESAVHICTLFAHAMLR